jgi:hypothetical protein
VREASTVVPKGWEVDGTGALVNKTQYGLNIPEQRTNYSEAVAEAKEAEHRDLLARADQIDKIVWAINFARLVMKMPQAEMDIRLAEMIVDGVSDVTTW